MTTDDKTVLDKQIDAFIHNLSQLDQGEYARLKRNAGKTLAEARQVHLLFYQKILPYGVSLPWQEEQYFLVATLYPFDKLQRSREHPAAGDADAAIKTPAAPASTLGDSFRRARSEQNETGLNRRLARLLDADAQQLPFQLRQAVLRLTADWIPINWSQLTRDVLNWTHPNRYVQRNWARDYVAARSETQ